MSARPAAPERPAPRAESAEPPEHRRHWASWALRALLLVFIAVHLLRGNRSGATVAGMGLVVTLIPPAISHFSRWHVPRVLEFTFVLAMFFQYSSESFKLFEIFTYWDKIVHPAEIFLATGVVTFLFLGYRHLHQLKIPDGLSAAGAMLFGMTLGASWELLEFALDWFGNANLQKSNADTMTDILTNDVGAIFGTLLAFWLYRHKTAEHQKQEFGEIAEWLTARLARLFERHGVLVGVVVALLIAGLVVAGWFTDRAPVPPPPPGQGQAGTWAFAPGAGPSGPTAVLRGDWRPDERGICRVNPQPPQPGSEQMGLLALAPGASYGEGAGFAAATRFYLERPPLGAGTAMEAGLAFGLRDPDDFYLLKASALHDVFVLERHLHGKQRDLREVRVRLHGNEWHDMRIEVRGDRVAAFRDGQPLFEERGVVDTDGGLGLWARVTSAGCFSQAEAQPLPLTAASAPRVPSPLVLAQLAGG
jgi:hypothetical protein